MSIGLTQHIDKKFIERIQAVAKGEGGSGASVAKALSGGASVNNIQTGLRAGAQTYTKSVQGLNFAISFANVARADLARLGGIADQMIELAEKSSKELTSQNKRNKMDLQFKLLAREFKEITEGTKFGERNYLNLEDMKSVFEVVGLDPSDSRSTDKALEGFVVSEKDDLMASENIKGRRPVPTPSGVPKPGTEHDSASLFDIERDMRSRSDAYAMLEDLKALRTQIDTNLKAFDATYEFLGDNLELVRAAAFAMLELSDQVASDAEAADVAKQLQKMIRKNARGALAQAENLEPMVVASMTLTDEKLLQGDA